MTVKEIFSKICTDLSNSPVQYGHAVVDASDEAVLILMHVLQVDFEGLNADTERALKAAELATVQALVNRRIERREPLAYVLGACYFAGLEFAVDRRTLVPRSPFAEWLNKGFAPWVDLHAMDTALDLCCGGGCIGLALAHHWPHLKVDLSDIDAGALEVAKINRSRHALEERVRVVQSDLFAELGAHYDLILSNPPYVSTEEYQQLPAEYTHEPRHALVSAAQGLLLPVRILASAANHLKPGGALFLEVGYSHEALQNAFPRVPFVWLQMESGGEGICVMQRDDLLEYRAQFEAFLERHVA